MKNETRDQQKSDVRALTEKQLDPAQKAELRRQMYERMARGSAMEEVEANARHQWR